MNVMGGISCKRPCRATSARAIASKGGVYDPRVSLRILRGETKAGQIPPLWDGQAAQRIAQDLAGA